MKNIHTGKKLEDKSDKSNYSEKKTKPTDEKHERKNVFNCSISI